MENKMTFKRALIIACIISTIATSAIIICTLITTYQFKNLGQIFNSYNFMQLGGSVTMGLWGLWFLLYENGRVKYYYSLISFGISIVLLFFMGKL